MQVGCAALGNFMLTELVASTKMVFPNFGGQDCVGTAELSLPSQEREANQKLAVSRNAQVSSSTATQVSSAHWLKQLPGLTLRVEGDRHFAGGF